LITKNALMTAAVGGCLLLFSENAVAQCVPVVYAFRHAEDLDPRVTSLATYTDQTAPSNTGNPHSLTKIGAQHANLYVEMIRSLEITQNYCAVGTVYALHPKKPDGTYGTTNPYYTARPLANIVMNANPIISVQNLRLGSMLVNGEEQPLKDAILNGLNNGLSIALFWDSEGLHALGNALSVGSNIPDKALGTTPPRNAAYIFEFKLGVLNPWTPTSTPQYIQCFNWHRSDGFSTHTYYCGDTTNPNLGGTPDKLPPDGNQIANADLYRLHGRICHLILTPPGSGYYGNCESAAKPPIWNQF
jgi:hypothetical protein